MERRRLEFEFRPAEPDWQPAVDVGQDHDLLSVRVNANLPFSDVLKAQRMVAQPTDATPQLGFYEEGKLAEWFLNVAVHPDDLQELQRRNLSFHQTCTIAAACIYFYAYLGVEIAGVNSDGDESDVVG